MILFVNYFYILSFGIVELMLTINQCIMPVKILLVIVFMK